MLIKQREIVHNPFHVYADVNNQLFQSEGRLSLKEDDKKLQQLSLVLIGAGNKVSVQEGAKIQERVKHPEEKAQSSTMIITGFRRAWYYGEETWSGINTSTRLIQKKNLHKDRMQGESNFQFPLIIDQSRNNMFTAKLSFCSASFENVQHDNVKVNNSW